MASESVQVKSLAIVFPMGAIKHVSLEELSGTPEGGWMEAIKQKVISWRPKLADAKLYIRDAENQFQALEEESQLREALDKNVKQKPNLRVFVSRDPSRLPPRKFIHDLEQRRKIKADAGDSEKEAKGGANKRSFGQCSKCSESLKGQVRYRCMQPRCRQLRLCVSCVDSGCHDQHVMLRLRPGQGKQLREKFHLVPDAPLFEAVFQHLAQRQHHQRHGPPRGVRPLRNLLRKLRCGDMEPKAGEKRLARIMQKQDLAQEMPQTAKLVMRIQKNINKGAAQASSQEESAVETE